MAAIDRTPYNALVDDDGSNLVGTPWTKNIVKTVLLDPIDVALATKIDTGGSPVFGGGITIGTVPITGPGGVLVVGGPITCNPYLAVGVNPAQSGTIRIPNDHAISARNQANDADLPVLYYDTSNRLVLGYAGTPLIPYSINQDLGLAPGGAVTWRQGFFSSGVGIGNLPAQGGALRLTNTQYINSRNGANTADIALLGLHSDDVIYMGSSGCIGVCPYNPATALGIGSSPWASIAVAGPITLNNTVTLTGVAGALIVSGDVTSNGPSGFRAPSAGGFFWPSKSFIASDANGRLNLTTSSGGVGVGLDFATEALLKIRNRAQNNDADLAWRNGYVSSSIAFGVNPANAGVIKLPQAGYVYARNAANTGDIFVIGCGVGGDDAVYVGHPGSVLNLRGTSMVFSGGVTVTPYLAVGVTPALSGTIRLPNNTAINFRNGANTADLSVVALDAAGVAYFGGDATATQLGGKVAIPSPGPHVIGATVPAVQYRIRVTGTFPREYGYVDDGTLQVPISIAESSSMVLLATIALGASGSSSIISAIRISPQLTSAGGTVVDAAALEVFAFGGAVGSITGTAANRAIWSHNNVQIDGALQFGGMTSTFPGLRRNGSALQAVVGTGTGLADFQCGAVAATNGTFDTFVKVGPNPATTGELRLPNNGEGIVFRNAANTGNVYGLYSDGANNVVVGDSVTSGTRFPAASITLRTAGIVFIDSGARALAIGALPAQSGPLRLAYNSYITARESTNTADRRLIGFFQNVDLDADASGVSFHGGRSLLICPADGTFELHNRGGNLWATLIAGQIIAKTGSLVIGASPGIQEFGTGSIALGGATTIACVQTSFDPVTSNLANGMWWVEATGVSPARQLRLAVRDGGATYYQNIGAAH